MFLTPAALRGQLLGCTDATRLLNGRLEFEPEVGLELVEALGFNFSLPPELLNFNFVSPGNDWLGEMHMNPPNNVGRV